MIRPLARHGREAAYYAALCLIGATSLPTAAIAKQTAPVPGAYPDPLIANPQSGATPDLKTQPVGRPPSAVTPPPLPATSSGPRDINVQPLPSLSKSVPPDAHLSRLAEGGTLPGTSVDPMRLDPATDPILALARDAAPPERFQAVIGAAVARNPALDETIAQADEAQGARNEAQARRFPTVELSFSHFNILSRAFSNDILNTLERSRPRERTDGLGSIRETIFDFGAGRDRVRAAEARLRAAALGAEDSATQLALRAVSAWYNVFGYRALLALTEDYAREEQGYRQALEQRVAQGYAAVGDLAQMDGYIAATRAQQADYQRSLANAEAQYMQLIGAPPPHLARAPRPLLTLASADGARQQAGKLPAVLLAREQADAASFDERAAHADTLPTIGGEVDAGRYGVFETVRDYDVRASATLTWRLFGGAHQHVEQLAARERGADAHYRRMREEAERDAAIAYADVEALEAAEKAIADNYMAARRSRDVLAERFRVSRGTLFDVVNANSSYFSVAAHYILTLVELDTARYALLARTGGLLAALRIQPPQVAR